MITVAEPIDADTLRIRHEFLSRPDLRVSVDYVATLLGIPLRHAQLILESLVWEAFLVRTSDAQYARPTAQGSELEPETWEPGAEAER
jgi:hypothetical protein